MTTAALVKDLREKTGAGMMDCKKALVETGNNFEEAIDWLRKKGLAAAAKKADRVAAEGLTSVSIDSDKLSGAIIEVNSETDFVARNDKFQVLVKTIADLALKYDNIESLKLAILPNGKSVNEEIIEIIATIGENINLRRTKLLKVKDGVISSYIHNSVAPDMGKIAVLVGLESSGDKSKLMSTAKQIAMHIAASNPLSLDINSLNASLIQKEREIFFEQSKASGKPNDIIEKMIEGRIRKYLEEVVLLEQIFVIDGKTKISEVLNNLSKELGSPVTITNFVKYTLGEGIQQEEKNFADEVAAVIKQ